MKCLLRDYRPGHWEFDCLLINVRFSETWQRLDCFECDMLQWGWKSQMKLRHLFPQTLNLTQWMVPDGSRRSCLQCPNPRARRGSVCAASGVSYTWNLWDWETYFCVPLRISSGTLWGLGPLLSSLWYCRHAERSKAAACSVWPRTASHNPGRKNLISTFQN